MELNNACVIVTGAGSGVGRALAVEFARHGAKVVCAGRRKSNLDKTVSALETEGGQGLSVPTDVTDVAQVDRLMQRAIDQFGAIDVLYNNAGSFRALGAVWEVDPKWWWQDVTVNLLGTMLCARAVLRLMMARDRGIIIHMRGGDRIPGGTGYSCSKVAIPRLVELQARELERQGSSVLVLGMSPGFVLTEMTRHQIESPEGQYWLPSSKQAIDEGHDRPPEDCARKSVELIRLASPELNGRTFTVHTDFDQVLRDLKQTMAPG